MSVPPLLLRSARWLFERGRRERLSMSAANRRKLPPVRKPRQIRRIIIIGAGLSGLCSAHLLTRAGHKVTVYEARSRPGGRVLTLRDPFPDGLHADVGAGRINDTHRWTLFWAKRFGLKLEPMYPSTGWLVGERNGQRIIGADASFLSAHHFHHIMMSHLPCDFRAQNKSPIAELLHSSLIKPSWYRIKGGMDLLPQAFADGLAGDIHYGCPVTAIDRDSDSVQVTFQCSGNEYTARGHFVVLCVPFTAQRSIRMAPPLCDEKQHIVRECTYESAVRVFLQLRDRSWLQGIWNGYGVTGDKLEVWQPTFALNSDRSLLVLYAQGDAARSLISLRPAERIPAALDRLNTLFPGIRNACDVATQFCWDEAPWSWGAQSNIRSMSGIAPDVVARAEGRIHFAGEQTSADGWMDGTLESAYRVSREITRAVGVQAM